MTIDYRVGDTRDLTAAIPDGSVSLVASSPPFLALRSYLPAGHDDKHAEIGSEPDPATFLDTLLGLTAEWGRVLAPWGSIAIELGDTYSGSSMTGGDDAGSTRYPGGRSTVQEINAPRRTGTWPRAKSLALIPQLYACSLAYGRNILTGAPMLDGPWLVRNVIVWHRPNPAVGALGDKFRPSTSYIVIATRSARRWFDLTAVRTAFSESTHQAQSVDTAGAQARAAQGGRPRIGPQINTHAGAPPLDTWFDSHDTWTITTQPSKLAHYAMWPPRLAERLILSMCPAQVCAVCGEPRRRVERTIYTEAPLRPLRDDIARTYGSIDGKRHNDHRATAQDQIGWTDCGCEHNDYIPGVVLDPFAGTGTTLAVAELHGRDSIGIDLDPRNRELLDARMVEVKRALFGTMPEMPGQMEMAL